VTSAVGLGSSDRYAHGFAVGDYDGDGDPDLLSTSYQGPTLFRNDGGCAFVDITAEAGLDRPGGWSTSAAWADFNGDGRLDLYITRYVNWSFANNPPCRYRYSGQVDICAPSVFRGLSDLLYYNEGGGRFREVGLEAGLVEDGKGLGVIAADLDGDRDVDIYVANDTSGNFLYRNLGHGRFEEIGATSGAGLSAEGIATGSMGVAAGDVDGDGDVDLFVTNYEGEINELYRNDGALVFTPVSMSLGLGALSRPMVGWGTGLIDFDNDGRLDVMVANGHLMHHLPGVSRSQPPLLFRQRDDGRFDEVARASGPYFCAPRPARGCAFGDLDNDGDVDIVVAHQNAGVVLLRNDSAPKRPALRLRLAGTKSHRDAVGTRIVVHTDGVRLTRVLAGGGSYLSQSDSRFTIGLGGASHTRRVEVHWPSGQNHVHHGLSAGRPWLLREGDAPKVDTLREQTTAPPE
jgi:hypothetical protein